MQISREAYEEIKDHCEGEFEETYYLDDDYLDGEEACTVWIMEYLDSDDDEGCNNLFRIVMQWEDNNGRVQITV